jgi:DNA-binding NtrC family response regulator
MRSTRATYQVVFVSQAPSSFAAAVDDLRDPEMDVLVAGADHEPAADGRATVVLVDGGVGRPVDVVARWRAANPGAAIYVVTDRLELAQADALRAAGARAVIAPGTERDVIESRLLYADASTDGWRDDVASMVVGEAPGLYDALNLVRAVSDTDSTVLVGGPSGAGKELIARAIHQGSPRRSGPFVAVNTAAIPEHLVETELFGHTKGAFTGAANAREGKLLAANGGTLFLDEIGDMPLAMQAKLLRVLQDRQVTPIGSDRPVPVDIRVVAASHRDIAMMAETGTFRSDLYYRLAVVTIDLQPLRERRADILPLATHLLRQANAQTGRAVTGFDRSAIDAMMSYDWPGNGRELANAVERAVVLRRCGQVTSNDLRLGRRAQARGFAPIAVSEGSLNLKSAVETLEKQFIEQALERSGGNRSEAAALLGLNRTTLVEKLRKLT